MGIIDGIRNTVPLIPSSWPVDVLLRIERDDGFETKWDKGRRIDSTEQGERYELKNRGKKTQAIPNDALIKTPSGNYVAQFIENSKGDLVPTKFDPDTKKVDAFSDEQTSKAYRYNRYNQARKFWQTQSVWQKYHSEISMVMFAVAFLIMSYGLIEFLGSVTTSMQNSANTMETAAETLARTKALGE